MNNDETISLADMVLSTDYYEPCPECEGSIPRNATTDEQTGRCFGCGYHEKDQDFCCDPTKPLDFN